jgi:hypothetical protein
LEHFSFLLCECLEHIFVSFFVSFASLLSANKLETCMEFKVEREWSYGDKKVNHGEKGHPSKIKKALGGSIS